MANDIGARITLQGEAQYRQALKQIAEGQKVMRAELEKVTAQFDGQERSIDALNEKHDVLERTLNGERERIDTLREAVQKSASAYGEADTRTMKWQEQLYKAEAAASKLEGQIRTLEETMANQEKAEAFTKSIQGQTAAVEDAEKKQELLQSEMGKLDAQYAGTGS